MEVAKTTDVEKAKNEIPFDFDEGNEQVVGRSNLIKVTVI